MFKKIITYLYKKYCDPDWVNMTRLQLQGVTHKFDPSTLTDKDKKTISREAKELLRHEVLQLALNNVRARVEMHIRNEAPTAEVIFYDRMTINGVALFEEELMDYANYEPDKEQKLLDDEKFEPL